MNNEDRARVWIKHTANNPYEYHKIKLASLLDAAEARGRKQTIDLRNATVAKVERKATIKDCIAAIRGRGWCNPQVTDILRALLADDTKDVAEGACINPDGHKWGLVSCFHCSKPRPKGTKPSTPEWHDAKEAADEQ